MILNELTDFTGVKGKAGQCELSLSFVLIIARLFYKIY